MRSNRRGTTPARIAFVAATFALAGCVPGAYVYEDAPVAYYGGGSAYYSSPAPAYYGYPGYYGYSGYYGYPGRYSYAPYPPRVVYVDHDHRGDDCRHESHRGQGPRNYRPPPPGQGPRDYRPPPPGQGPREHRPPPPDQGPREHRPPPPGQGPRDYRPPPRPAESQELRGYRGSRPATPRDTKSGEEDKRELD